MKTIGQQLIDDGIPIVIPSDTLANQYDIDFWIEVTDDKRIGIRLHSVESSDVFLDTDAHDTFQQKYVGRVFILTFEEVDDERRVLDYNQDYVDIKKEIKRLQAL